MILPVGFEIMQDEEWEYLNSFDEYRNVCPYYIISTHGRIYQKILNFQTVKERLQRLSKVSIITDRNIEIDVTSRLCENKVSFIR